MSKTTDMTELSRQEDKLLTLQTHQARMRYALLPHAREDIASPALEKLRPNAALIPEEAMVLGLIETRSPTGELPPVDLERFRGLSKQDQERALGQFYSRWMWSVSSEAEETAEQTLKARVACAWRIVREMARNRGMVRVDQTLVEALGVSSYDDESAEAPDHWRIPQPLPAPETPEFFNHIANKIDTRDQPYHSDVIRPMREGERTPAPWRVSLPAPEESEPELGTAPDRRTEHKGFALLPPGIPRFFVDPKAPGTVIGDYDPNKDELLLAYIRCQEACARRLGIYEGTIQDPTLGIEGMKLIADPETIRATYPTPEMLIAWELHLVEETYDLVVNLGRHETIKTLRRTRGLRHYEAMGLIRMSMSEAVRRSMFSAEEEKALMLSVLENHRLRAREACDLRAELQNIKATIVVQGLARVAPEDSLSMFVNAVRSVAASREIAPAAPTPTLPASEGIPTGFAGQSVVSHSKV